VQGQPRPRIVGDPGNCITVYDAHASTLHHLTVLNQTNDGFARAIAMAGTGTIDGVLAKSLTGFALHLGSGPLVRNTVAICPSGGFCVQASTGTVTLRNLTVYGASVLARQSTAGQTTTATATNVIATGGFQAMGVAGGPATIAVDHSYGPLGSNSANGTVTAGAGNLTTGAAFVNATTEDFHQATGSTTIGAGADNAANGPTDFDDGARQNGTTDIGADEFGSAIPTVTTGAASEVTETTAKIAGIVNPNGVATEAYFEVGPTTAYTLQTSKGPLSGNFADDTVSGSLSGLTPATTYHYRIVAADGTSVGEDRTFTTSGAAVAPAGTTTPPGDSTPAPTSGGTAGGDPPVNIVLAVVSARLLKITPLKSGKLVLRFRFTGAGKLNVKGLAKRLKVFSIKRSITKAGTLKLTLTPSAAARKLLRKKHRLAVKLTIGFTAPGAKTVTLKRKSTLIRR
jgi:hypothetical protein